MIALALGSDPDSDFTFMLLTLRSTCYTILNCKLQREHEQPLQHNAEAQNAIEYNRNAIFSKQRKIYLNALLLEQKNDIELIE